MKYREFISGIAAVFLVLPGSVSAKETSKEKQIREMFERTPEQILPLIQLSGDSMDPSLKVSTFGVSKLVSKGLLASTTYENSFLRGFVNKSTRAVSIQVYHSAVYTGSNWYHLNRATFEDADGLKETSLDRINSDVACGRYGCTYSEDVAFDISIESLEKLAAKYNPMRKDQFLRYRLFGKSGDVINEGIPLNEIAAFVIKIKDLTKSNDK
jgi:hypothetical protein